MKYFLLLLLSSIFFMSIVSNIYAETTSKSNMNLYILGNIQTFEFKECKWIWESLSLTYKWKVVSTTSLSTDNFVEDPQKRLWRFSFFVSLPLEPLNLDNYRVVSWEGEVYSLMSYYPKLRVVQDTTVILPDIVLFCNKKDLNSIIQKSYQEDVKNNKWISWYESSPTKDTKSTKFTSFTLFWVDSTTNKELGEMDFKWVNVKITDIVSNEVVFKRENFNLPYTTTNINELGEFQNSQYTLDVSKDWYKPYHSTFIINQESIRVPVYLTSIDSNYDPLRVLSSNTTIEIGTSSNTTRERQEKGSGQVWSSKNNNWESTDNTSSNNWNLVKILLVNKDKWTYSINIDWLQVEEWKGVLINSNWESKIEVFKDNKLVLTKKENIVWTISIDVWETSIISYVIWVSLSLILIVVYFIVKRKYLVKSKLND